MATPTSTLPASYQRTGGVTNVVVRHHEGNKPEDQRLEMCSRGKNDDSTTAREDLYEEQAKAKIKEGQNTGDFMRDMETAQQDCLRDTGAAQFPERFSAHAPFRAPRLCFA